MGASHDRRALDQTHLIIDPGYLTVDWLFSKGSKPMLERSGAFNGGVSAILNEVDKAFNKKYSRSLNGHTIDEALRTGSVSLMGKKIDFSPFQAIAQRKSTNIVALLLAEINADQVDRSSGSALSVDNIVLTGGGASYFEQPLRAHFENHFVTLQNPVMGNVQGFLEFGKRLAGQLV